MYSRRYIVKIAAGALTAPLQGAKIDSRINGVAIGLHTFSFSNFPHDGVIDAILQCMTDVGIGECILLAQQIEPGELWQQIRQNQPEARAKLTAWRSSISLDYFRAIRRRFERVGIDINGFGPSLTPDAPAEEVSRVFEMAASLGATIVTVGGTMALAKRLARVAGEHGMLVGLQGRPNMRSADPEQISRSEDYAGALALSQNFRLSFDIGDATGGGYDVLPFLRDHRSLIHSVYLKDRRKDRTSVPWGEGDTPIAGVLQWIRDGKYPIRAFIDCDYQPDTNRAVDIKRCFAYARKALA
jgi:sugar phosphate isomerase/epimerase